MTLATHVVVCNPVSEREAQEAFLVGRRAIGIPAEHPFDIREPALGYRNGIWIRSEPGGFDSALDVSHAYGELLDYYDDEEDYLLGWLDVRFDTAYGYREGSTGCDALHDSLVCELGAWCDERGLDWWAKNEYEGTWHHRAAPYGTR